MEKEYRYDAFISYRHLEKDKKVAEKLQKMLESYKPPKSMSKGFKNWRIFRDETELTTSSNLSDDIKRALENSRYLIVVCSEETKNSRWCQEEISYFKKLHKGSNKNIITLVTDGEAPEVFPEELCNEVVEVTDENGVVSYHTQATEPLAANVAAASEKETLKKLKTEFLRIAAPLLGCGYDALYNRNQKRAIRRLLMVAILIISFLLAFGLYTSAMLLEIQTQKNALQVANNSLQEKTEELNRKNTELQTTNQALEKKTQEAQENATEANRQKQIAEENLEEANRQKRNAELNLEEANRQKQIAEENLEEANRQKQIAEDNLEEANRQKQIAEVNLAEADRQRGIAEENMEIAQQNERYANEQTRVAQIENAENLSALSESKWNSGDAIEAVETVLQAFPQEGETRPVVVNAERVLAKEIGAFERKSFRPVLNLAHNKPVTCMGYAGGGATLVTQDADCVYLWDTQSGALKAQYADTLFGGFSDAEVYFENDGKIEKSGLTRQSGGMFIMDDTGYMYIYGYEKNVMPEVGRGEDDLYIFSSGKQLYKIDGETGSVLWEIPGEHYCYWDVLDDVVVKHMEEGKAAIRIELYDKQSGRKLETYNAMIPDGLSCGLIEWSGYTGTKLYYGDSGSYFSAYDGTAVYAIDLSESVSGMCSTETLIQPPQTVDERIIACTLLNEGLLVVRARQKGLYFHETEVLLFDIVTNRLKWETQIGDIEGNIVNYIDMLYAEETRNYCDMVVLAQGNCVMLMNAQNGNLEHTYHLKSNILYAYGARNGLIYFLTADGNEVAVAATGLKKENINSAYYSGLYGIRAFLSAPEMVSYQNGSYAVLNQTGSEVYIYTEAENSRFQEFFRNPNNSSNMDVCVNNSATYAVVREGDKNIYICDISSETVQKIAETDMDYVKICFLDEERVGFWYRSEDKMHLRIYDVARAEIVMQSEVEGYSVEELVRCSDGVAWWNDDGIGLVKGDGTIIQKEFKTESQYTFREWDDGSVITCSYAQNGRFAVLVNYYTATGKRIEVGHPELEEYILMDTHSIAEKLRGAGDVNLVWLSSERLAACFEDHTICIFDATTGALMDTFSYETPNVLSIYGLGDGKSVAILCSDGRIYKLNLETKVMDGVIDLGIPSLQGTTYKSSDSGLELIPEQGAFIFHWYDDARVVDIENFKIRYEIPNYQGYSADANLVAVNEYYITGYYPLYQTSELVEMGNEFLLKK